MLKTVYFSFFLYNKIYVYRITIFNNSENASNPKKTIQKPDCFII